MTARVLIYSLLLSVWWRHDVRHLLLPLGMAVLPWLLNGAFGINLPDDDTTLCLFAGDEECGCLDIEVDPILI